ncbi:helix-turn-helix domain-containing protein [Ruegeria sediminis]|uniref:helix-turn-helix domain-containing protein n=1 Tax=Ruegeria sediminis TaxID=2583820 RepID=UPI001486894C|nr:helix-turn-helix transcriptional regulator [Ruegeria sediminis]
MEISEFLNCVESNDETRAEFGKYVKEARRNVGLTQQQLAVRTGLNNPSFIAAIEAGKSRLPAERLEFFAEALELEPRALAWEAIKGWDMDVFMSVITEPFRARKQS